MQRSRLTLMEDGSLRCFQNGVTLRRREDGSCYATHPLCDVILAERADGMAWDCFQEAISRLNTIDEEGGPLYDPRDVE